MKLIIQIPCYNEAKTIEKVVKDQGFDDRLKDEYIGSMRARLKGLTVGSKGLMLNTPRSIDFVEMLDLIPCGIGDSGSQDEPRADRQRSDHKDRDYSFCRILDAEHESQKTEYDDESREPVRVYADPVYLAEISDLIIGGIREGKDIDLGNILSDLCHSERHICVICIPYRRLVFRFEVGNVFDLYAVNEIIRKISFKLEFVDVMGLVI